MSYISNKNIIQEMWVIIYKYLGYSKATKFDNLTRDIKLNFTGLTDSEQITQINNFWREHLMQYPDTVELRAWLTDGTDLIAYLNAFERHWVFELDKKDILT